MNNIQKLGFVSFLTNVVQAALYEDICYDAQTLKTLHRLFDKLL